ncbi:MAG: hypothetical protein JWR90_1308 [Marmoricola sp.]|nr:hypothetical protein [Marmoricola sp.]
MVKRAPDQDDSGWTRSPTGQARLTTYKRAWGAFWSAVAAGGFGLALLEWPAVGVFLTLGMLLVLCWSVAHLLPDQTLGWSPLTAAVGILAVWSFCQVTPPLGLFVVLGYGLSCPAVIGCGIRSPRRSFELPAGVNAAAATREESRPRNEAADFLTPPEALGPLNGLDDWDLCRLWRESFWVLRQPAPTTTALCLVALRGACLDELERRDAVAMRAWLDSGARASSGPEKYFALEPPRGST